MDRPEAKLSDWVLELKLQRLILKTEVYSKREPSVAKAFGQFIRNVSKIDYEIENLVQESENYMKEEEVKVQQLLAEGEENLPADIKWPVPLEEQESSDTMSVLSSLDFTVGSVSTSFYTASTGSDRVHSFELNLRTEDTKLPKKPTVTHSVLPGVHSIVADISHCPGLTLFIDGMGLYQLESSERAPVRIPDSLHCYNICLSGSEEFLVTEARWKTAKREFSGTKRVRRFQLMKDDCFEPTLMDEFYEVEESKDLRGLASSPEGLVAVCDPHVKRITVHTVPGFSRVDTIHIDRLFAHELMSTKPTKPKSLLEIFKLSPSKEPVYDDDLLRPMGVTWLTDDRLCVKMRDNQTITCLSLKYKEIIWAQSIPDAKLLSAAHERVYVSHWGSPARFTVLHADSGKILSNETITCPGPGKSLKVFQSPVDGRVVAFSY